MLTKVALKQANNSLLLPRMKDVKKYLPILGSVFFWAMSFVWVKQAYASFTPIVLVVARLIGASLLMIPIGLITKRLKPLQPAHLKLFLILAFFEPFLYFMAESYGLKYVSSSVGAVIISTVPLFTPFVSTFFTKERVSLMSIIGIVVSFCGVGLLVFDTSGGLDASSKGIALMGLAVFAAVFYPVMINKLMPHYNGFTIITYQNIIGIVYFIPVFFITDGLSAFTAEYTTESLISFANLTVFASVLAFLLFTYSVKNIGITRTNSFINLIPVITTVAAFFILGDSIGWQESVGIVIVISGLFLSQRKK